MGALQYFGYGVLTVAVFFNSAAASCSCKKVKSHYLDMGCKPVSFGGNDCCPQYYECDQVFKKIDNCNGTCYFQGSYYKVGEYVPYPLTESGCLTNCWCDQKDNKPFLNCKSMGCLENMCRPETFAPIMLKYKLDKCCSTGVINFPSDPPLCVVGKETFREGEKFSVSDKCEVCVCQRGYRSPFVEPLCRPVNCNTAIKNPLEFSKFCAPVYRERECCPFTWHCGSKDTEHLGAPLEKHQVLSMNQCRFVNRVFNRGDKFVVNLDEGERAVCECSLPPLISCLVTDGSEITEGTTEKRTEKPIERTTEKRTEKPTEKPTERTTEKRTEGTTEKRTEGTTEKRTEKPTERTTEKRTEKPTERTTEKRTEKPTERTTEKRTEKPTERTTEKRTQRPTEKSTEKPTERTTEKRTEKPTERTTERHIDKLTERTTEKRTEGTTEKRTEKPTERTTEKRTEKPTERTTEKRSEKPTEKPIERTTEKRTEGTTEKRTEKPTERTTEKRTEKPTEKSTEKRTENPTERTTRKRTEGTTEKRTEETTEKRTEKPTEKTTEKRTEKPTERTTEKRKEKPTERTTEKRTEKPSERTTEKRTEKPTEKPTERTTEKPTERTTEKRTEKPTERTTEKRTEKPTEKPTERTTEKRTEKPTEKTTEKLTERTTEKRSNKPIEKPTERTTEKRTEKPTERTTEKRIEKPTERTTEKRTEKRTEKPTVKVTERSTQRFSEGVKSYQARPSIFSRKQQLPRRKPSYLSPLKRSTKVIEPKKPYNYGQIIYDSKEKQQVPRRKSSYLNPLKKITKPQTKPKQPYSYGQIIYDSKEIILNDCKEKPCQTYKAPAKKLIQLKKENHSPEYIEKKIKTVTRKKIPNHRVKVSKDFSHEEREYVNRNPKDRFIELNEDPKRYPKKRIQIKTKKIPDGNGHVYIPRQMVFVKPGVSYETKEDSSPEYFKIFNGPTRTRYSKEGSNEYLKAPRGHLVKS